MDLASLHALEIRILRAYQNNASAEQSDAQLQSGAGLGEGQVRRAVEWVDFQAVAGSYGREYAGGRFRLRRWDRILPQRARRQRRHF